MRGTIGRGSKARSDLFRDEAEAKISSNQH